MDHGSLKIAETSAMRKDSVSLFPNRGVSLLKPMRGPMLWRVISSARLELENVVKSERVRIRRRRYRCLV
jgi:hypothetical protein